MRVQAMPRWFVYSLRPESDALRPFCARDSSLYPVPVRAGHINMGTDKQLTI